MIPSTTDTQSAENTYQVCSNHSCNLDTHLKQAAQEQNYDAAIKWIELGANPKVIGAYDPSFDRNLLDNITRLFMERKDLAHASLSAMAMADLDYDHIRDKVIWKVCEQLLNDGEIEAAIQLAQEIRIKRDTYTGKYESTNRDHALNQIVEHLLKINHVERAIEVTDLWMSEESKTNALLQIIRFLLDNNELHQAMEFSLKIPDNYARRRDTALCEIGERFFENQEIESAVKVFEHMTTRSGYNDIGFGLLKKIVDHYLQLNQIYPLIVMVDHTSCPAEKTEVLNKILNHLIDHKEYDNAMQLLMSKTFDSSSIYWLDTVVKKFIHSLLEIKDYRRAIQVADMMENQVHRNEMYKVIINSLTAEGRVDEAQKLKEKMNR